MITTKTCLQATSSLSRFPHLQSLSFLFLFLFGISVYAQNNGKITTFDAMGRFSGEFAAVSIQGKKYLLHCSGKIMVDKVLTTYMGFSIVAKNGAYGAIDKNGNLLADFKYADVKIETYHSSLNKEANYKFLIVKNNGKYGIINKEGKIICPPEYEAVEGINRYVAGIKKKGLWGWVSLETGEILVQPKYLDIWHCYQWSKVVYIENEEGKNGLSLNTGKVLVAPSQDQSNRILELSGKRYITFQEGQKFGLLDSNGTQVIAPHYDALLKVKGSELLQYRIGEKVGLMKISGKRLTEPIYTKMRDAINGRILVENQKKGVIDLEGNVILPVKYDDITIINESYEKSWNAVSIIYTKDTDKDISEERDPSFYFLVLAGKKQGLLNWHGKEIIPAIYEWLKPYKVNDKTWFLASKNKKQGLISPSGKLVLPFAYDALGDDAEEFYEYGETNAGEQAQNHLLVRKQDKIGLYSFIKQKIVIPVENKRIDWINEHCIALQKVDPASDAEDYEHLFAIVQKDGSVLSNFSARKAYLVAPNRLVQSSGKTYSKRRYLLKDLEGNILYENEGWEFKYDWFNRTLVDLPEGQTISTTTFQNGLLKIRGSEENLFVNKKGKEIRFEKYNYVGDFWKGLAIVQRKTATGSYVGIIDRKGNEVLPTVYEGVHDISGNNFLLKIVKEGHYGIINKKGDVLLPPVYNRIYQGHKDTYFTIKKDKKQGIANLNGEIFTSKLYPCFKKNTKFDTPIWPILIKDEGWFRYLKEDGSCMPFKAKDKIGY